MGRSQETFNKKEVRSRKEKKRKDKAEKRASRKDSDKKGGLDDMIAYVDENGMIVAAPPDPSLKEEINAEDIELGIPKSIADPEEDKLRTGVVSFFNESKGYGFIRDQKTKDSVFVHINDIEDEIKEGNLVTFEKVKGKKGPAAQQVKIKK
jgi:cold shock CspA family protein